MLFDKLDDTSRGSTGVGGQWNIWDSTLNKYVLFLPTETLPSVVGSISTVDHDVTTSETVGKIKGKLSIEDKEIQFLWHRDNLVRLNQFLNKQNDFLVSYPDGTGWKFTSEYVYKPDDSTSSEKVTGTINLISSKVDSVASLNVRDMMAPTCFITTTLDGEVEIEKSKSVSYTLTANADDVTYEVVSDNTGITATETGGKLTITAGSGATTGIVELKANKTGMASWTTTILVTVK